MLTNTKSHKSWNGTNLADTATRASEAYLSKVESGSTKLYLVGDNHIRVCSKEVSGFGEFRGVLIEGQAENKCLQSIKPATVPWANAGGGLPAEDTAEVAAPDGTNTAALMGAGDQPYQVITITAAAEYSVGLWIRKKTDIDQAQGIRISNQAYSSKGLWYINPTDLPDDEWVFIHRDSQYVNVTNEMVGHTGDVGGPFIESYTGSPEFYIWNVQVILGKGLHYYSSPITTAASSVIRPADSLIYDIDGLLSGAFAIRGTFTFPSYAPNAKKVLCHLAADASNYIQVYIDTDEALKAVSAIGSGDAGSVSCAGSVCNDKSIYWQLSGQKGKLQIQWSAHDSSTIVTATDPSFDMPQSLTDQYIGSDAASAYHFGPGLIADVQISNQFVSSLSEPWSGHSMIRGF